MTICASALSSIVLMIASAACAQDDPAATLPANAQATPDSPRADRPQLLREGTRLVEAAGEVVRDSKDDRLIFRTVTSTAQPDAAASELILLPSTRLEEIDRLMQSMERESMSFEITGRVYLYLGRNYLLPQQAMQAGAVAAPAAPVESAPAHEVNDETGQNDPGDETAEARRRETDRIIADLERSLGPTPTTQRDLASSPADASHGDLRYREGTMIVQRRGRPAMTENGRWRIVFDADATGFADPPMLLLQCQLLERLQRLGQRDVADRAVRITGEIYTCRGQAYLLPLSFHEATDRSRLDG